MLIGRASDREWAADFSSLWIREDWDYLWENLALFARRVIGSAVTGSLRQDLALKVLWRRSRLDQELTGLTALAL